ncbi:MAG: transporter substrate-binding domain-containing protein [Deltaproteobacteria bacterium]|nr:transporter substrate-binding domain-containing protein [Deltaproteobacteria bacterium]
MKREKEKKIFHLMKYSRANFCRTLFRLCLVALFLCVIPLAGAQDPKGMDSSWLTTHEKQWLSSHPVIRIAPDPNFPPIESFDENGEYQGIAADFMQQVQKETGINFQVVRCNTWNEVLEKARSGKIDALPAAAQTPARSGYLLFADPHLVLPGVIITRAKVKGTITLKDLSAMRVSVVKSYVWQELLEADFPGIQLDLTPDLQTGLKKVAMGISDALVATLPVAIYYIEKQGITNLRVAGETGYYTKLSFASRNDWPELNAIVGKALARISPKKKDEILGKWIRLKENSIFMSTLFWMILIGIIVVCSLIIIAIFAWNRFLKKVVNQKTEELRIELAERKRAEEYLRQSEEKYRLLADNTLDTLWILDIDTLRISHVSPSIERLSGYRAEEITGRHIGDILTPASITLVTNEISGQLAADNLGQAKAPTVELEQYRKDGSTVWTEVSTRFLRNIKGVPYSVVCVTRDITKRRSLEAKLRQAQKMESIGTLSGGIAHNFNNIMSIIMGNAELALSDMPECNSAHANLEEIKSASLRAKTIVAQLLAFSRTTDQDLKPTAVVPIVNDVLASLRSTRPGMIDICTDLVDAGQTVLADPVQLNQIMMSLCSNASEAMEDSGGILTVKVESAILDKTSPGVGPELNPGDYVRIIVSDTGPGISPDIIDRIFDPYFTTKGFEKGAGMGLAMVHGIIKNNNGAIFVDSTPCKGAVFSVLLPMTHEKPETKTGLAKDIPTGNETILFVDDEESIMKLGLLMLEPLGYTVDATMSPTDALNLFRAAPDRYDIVISDMSMPEMTGVCLAEELIRIRPNIPVIICTGQSTLNDEQKAKSVDIVAFVMKPVSRRKLAKIIRQVLDNENGK